MPLRTRRSNAGNRLQSLLAKQTPLDDPDSELFAERDDDEDFDLEAEEDRLRQSRHSKEADSADDKDNNTDDEKNGSEGDDDDDNDDDDDDDEDSSHDDSNFSDTTDDSELERDEEPVDAGEKELQKEQRTSAKEKRIAERNKMFKIKVRPPPEEKPAKPKRKRVFVSADILLEKGRHSERKSALRNKHQLIEQMREAEQRRSQYVAPKRKKVPKLTQEQRLEEAKKTELRNLSSLNKFVELEEERKKQQRLAMISRRPKLTHFVRFHSSQYLEPPKPVQIIEEHEKTSEDLVKQELSDQLKPDAASNPIDQSSTPNSQTSSTVAGDATEDAIKEPHNTELKNSMKKVNEASNNAQLSHSSPDDEPSEPKATPMIQSGTAEDTNANANAAIATTSATTTTTTTGTPPPVSELASEPSNEHLPSAVPLEDDTKDTNPDVKQEEDESVVKIEQEEEEKPPVYGPQYLRTYDFLTLHEFADVHINKYSLRSIILGPIASAHSVPPLKRMCPFSGKEARYIDPSTGVAYRDLETNKLIKLVRENKLGWSKELGGVFTLSGSEQRHAKGVPEGFA